jgi:hypothetical protein
VAAAEAWRVGRLTARAADENKRMRSASVRSHVCGGRARGWVAVFCSLVSGAAAPARTPSAEAAEARGVCRHGGGERALAAAAVALLHALSPEGFCGVLSLPLGDASCLGGLLCASSVISGEAGCAARLGGCAYAAVEPRRRSSGSSARYHVRTCARCPSGWAAAALGSGVAARWRTRRRCAQGATTTAYVDGEAALGPLPRSLAAPLPGAPAAPPWLPAPRRRLGVWGGCGCARP